MKSKFKIGDPIYAIEWNSIKSACVRHVDINKYGEVSYSVRFDNSSCIESLHESEVFATPKELVDRLIKEFEDFNGGPIF